MNIEISDEMAIELIDAYCRSNESGEIDDLKHIRNVVGTLLLEIPDPRGAQAPSLVAVEAKGRLTPHQREVYNRLARISRRQRDPWVPAAFIGSKNACDRLAEKGWIEIDITYGPRGGELRHYRPVVSSTALSTPVDIGGAS